MEIDFTDWNQRTVRRAITYPLNVSVRITKNDQLQILLKDDRGLAIAIWLKEREAIALEVALAARNAKAAVDVNLDEQGSGKAQ